MGEELNLPSIRFQIGEPAKTLLLFFQHTRRPSVLQFTLELFQVYLGTYSGPNTWNLRGYQGSSQVRWGIRPGDGIVTNGILIRAKAHKGVNLI